ncbi:porin [Polaromonas sp.]|nr:porin [Polaromonas sp.]
MLNSAGINGSRFGLKGSEDLGGGLKAIFQLENGFNIDDGSMAQGNTLFGRQAFVGVESGFGTVTVGRQYSAYYDFMSPINHNGDAATFNATNGGDNGGVAANGMKDYQLRVNNSVKFKTANYSGFSATVLYGLGENKTASTDSTDTVSLNLVYAKGPLVVGYAYQEEKQPAFSSADQDKNKYNLIGASYDFGVAKINGSYNEAKNDVFKDKEYQVGVVVPFGAAAISAGYADSKSDFGDMSYKGKGYSLLATYDMSKRTALYAGITDTKAHIMNEEAETKTQTYGLGVRHSF